MSLIERRASLLQQINSISDEQTLEMLQETIDFHAHTHGKDIIDDLDKLQLQELSRLTQEPAAKDTISEEAFKNLFARWSTK